MARRRPNQTQNRFLRIAYIEPIEQFQQFVFGVILVSLLYFQTLLMKKYWSCSDIGYHINRWHLELNLF
jgi:hypothetical protein